MEILTENFKASNPRYANLNIYCDAYWGEGDASSMLMRDINQAADVMFMADDMIRQSVACEALLPFLDSDRHDFAAACGAEAIQACSIDGDLFGLPYRADNGPMPIYDTTLFSGENAGKLNSLEGMLEVAQAAGKKVFLDMSNGWYNPFLLWAAGGDFGIQKEANGSLSIATNFGNQSDETRARRAEIAKVLEATKALYNQYQDTWVISSDNCTIENYFQYRDCAVAFLWNDLDFIKSKNGNVAVTKWPTLKVEDQDFPLHCFQSYKAIVCKYGTNSKRAELAQAFARYLAGPEAQRLRAEMLHYGPADINVAGQFTSDQFPFFAPMQEMAAAGLTHSQATRTTGDFWTPIGNLGGLVTDKTSGWGTYGTADRALQNMLSSSGWRID